MGDRDSDASPPIAHDDRAGDATVVTTDFVACYRYHYRGVTRARRLSGADPASAEDLAQEAFARALPQWRRIRRGTNPAGYVYRSAFRLAQRAERRRSRRAHLEAVAPGPPTEGDILTSVSVEAGLLRMPLRRRQCAVLCLVIGFRPSEAAEILRIAPGTVRKHLDEAKRELRTSIDYGEVPL